MISLKEHLSSKVYNHKMDQASVSVSSNSHTLFLTLNKQEVITGTSYEGTPDPWLSSLCEMISGKSLMQATQLSPRDWESRFESDQIFWDLWAERNQDVFFRPVELLRAAVDKFQGREHLYLPASPLVCRCFGVREEDIIQGVKSKAGMGCRSCRPQLQRLIKIHENQKLHKKRYFKEMPFADWLILADEKLEKFPLKTEWNMEVGGFKGNGILIHYNKVVTQKEEEEMAKKLQDFLGLALDADLSFFLRRA